MNGEPTWVPTWPDGWPACEFCNQAPSGMQIHAENTEIPTHSVLACAGCFTKLVEGQELRDIFGWTWSVSESRGFSVHEPETEEGDHV